MVRSRRLELPRVAPQRPQRCASTNSATTATVVEPTCADGERCSKSFSQAQEHHVAFVKLKSQQMHFVQVSPDKAALAALSSICQKPVERSNSMTDRSDILTTLFPTDNSAPVRWRISDELVPYEFALAEMEREVAEIASGKADELVWLLEHPPLYTAGTSANVTDLIDANRFPVYDAGRGGEYTYHGPGQRVAYVMLDLKRRKQDVRAYVAALEQVIISTLDKMNIKGERREDRVGVWVQRPERPRLPDGSMAEDKIAALGIRLRKWVSFHGLSINVDPDLEHFGGIVPCGITQYGVTSLVDLGSLVMMSDVDVLLRQSFEEIFGPTTRNIG
jgi:lipoyl(octanoyl) transferase